MTDKGTRAKKQQGPLTLNPLKFEEALDGLLKTEPPQRKRQQHRDTQPLHKKESPGKGAPKS